MSLELSPEVFSILAALIEERIGLCYRADDRPLLQSKLASRVVDAGFASFLDYYYFLRYDSAAAGELQDLTDVLVVNESYLFREYRQLIHVVDEILVPAVARGERPRVWSAACACGEEPYGLAMLLSARGILSEVDIVASDVSRRAIERARRGELGRRALREVREPELVERWVEATPTGARVRAPLPEHIDFRQVNLADGGAIRRLGKFDVIFCRNVLIYFSDELVRQVVANLLSRLEPGGSLWVGISESLMRFGSMVTCEERAGVFFYKEGEA